MVEFWEFRNRFLVLLSIMVSILLFCHAVLPATVIVYTSDIVLMSILFEFPLCPWRIKSAFQVYWRTIFLYMLQVIATFYCSFLMFSTMVGSVTLPIILLLVAVGTGIAIFLYPVPSPTHLSGPHKRIGTLSFSLSTKEINISESGSGKTKSPFENSRCVQCWFPIEESIGAMSGKSAKWTSGHADIQMKESKVLMEAVAENGGLPSFALRHLALAKSNVSLQASFQHLVGTEHPVALYSHGLYGWRQIHHSSCEVLASHGFLVFSMDHSPDCMVSRTPAGSPFQSELFSFPLPRGFSADQERAFYLAGLERRLADLTRLLDFLESSEELLQRFPELGGHRLDLARVCAWGHSYGGGSVTALSCLDPRVAAVVVLDGWLYPVPDEVRRRGSQRAAVLNLSAELWKYAQAQGPYREDFIRRSRANLQRARASPAVPVFDLVVRGTDHQNFCDVGLAASRTLLRLAGVIGPAAPDRVLRCVDSLVLAFFLAQLDLLPPQETFCEPARPPDEQEGFFYVAGPSLQQVNQAACPRGSEVERLIAHCCSPVAVDPDTLAFLRSQVVSSADLSHSYDYSFFRRTNPDDDLAVAVVQ